jgi:environmental stress-induced protein Ves
MNARMIPASAYHRTEWRNGGGMTSEIAAMPAANGRFVWRVSVADVEQSGAFSDFSGYERIIAVADGAGMRLSVDGRDSVLLTADSDPYAFPGAAPATCALVSGAVRDFNLIFDPSLCRSAVTRLRLSSGPVAFDAKGLTVLIYAPRHNLTVEHAALGRQDVPAGATCAIDDAEERLLIAGPTDATSLVAAIASAGGSGPAPC